MDPNSALQEIRDFAKKIRQRSKACQDEGKTRQEDLEYLTELAISMSEKFEELDCWIAAGGFTPNDWDKLNYKTLPKTDG